MSHVGATVLVMATIVGITTIGFLFGTMYGRQNVNLALEKCAKQYNVYVCEIVALPILSQPQEEKVK